MQKIIFDLADDEPCETPAKRVAPSNSVQQSYPTINGKQMIVRDVLTDTPTWNSNAAKDTKVEDFDFRELEKVLADIQHSPAQLQKHQVVSLEEECWNTLHRFLHLTPVALFGGVSTQLSISRLNEGVYDNAKVPHLIVVVFQCEFVGPSVQARCRDWSGEIDASFTKDMLSPACSVGEPRVEPYNPSKRLTVPFAMQLKNTTVFAITDYDRCLIVTPKNVHAVTYF